MSFTGITYQLPIIQTLPSPRDSLKIHSHCIVLSLSLNSRNEGVDGVALIFWQSQFNLICLLEVKFAKMLTKFKVPLLIWVNFGMNISCKYRGHINVTHLKKKNVTFHIQHKAVSWIFFTIVSIQNRRTRRERKLNIEYLESFVLHDNSKFASFNSR